MKVARFIVLVLVSAGCSQTTTPGQSSEAPSAALLSQERAWTEAFKNRDRNVLNEVLADDFVFTDDEGNLYDKAKYIAAVMDVIQVASYTADDMTVRVYGDSAVVVGRWTGTMSIDGKDASGAFRFTDTFVRRDGRWEAVASQDTRLPRSQTQ